MYYSEAQENYFKLTINYDSMNGEQKHSIENMLSYFKR